MSERSAQLRLCYAERSEVRRDIRSVRAITPDDRKRVIDQVDRVSGERGVSDEAKAKLGKIRLAMSRTDCAAICSN